jgi:hypothetical protein
MNKTDFAELKEKLILNLTKSKYASVYYATYESTVTELLEIIQSQSECMNGYSHDYITLKMNACISETNTRLQKLREGAK